MFETVYQIEGFHHRGYTILNYLLQLVLHCNPFAFSFLSLALHLFHQGFSLLLRSNHTHTKKNCVAMTVLLFSFDTTVELYCGHHWAKKMENVSSLER